MSNNSKIIFSIMAAARRQGLKVVRVKMPGKDAYFVKDSKGKVLHDCRSLELDELRQLFPPAASCNK
ncbi:MAG: hypothetical protein M8357_00580 [Desulfobulbaceae bacterium]|nr:hypothetical protein [Desulfobulbaceae bacterium]